jgi:hypothetical protein
MPLVETYLVRFFFLIPLACALCVLLWAHVFFCCWWRRGWRERGRGVSDCFGHEVCVGQLPKYPYGRVGDTYVVHSYPSRVNRFTVVMRGVEAHAKEEALSATADASRRSSRLYGTIS